MKKFILVKFMLLLSVLFCIFMILNFSTPSLNRSTSSSTEPSTFRFEISGQEGDEIYAEIVTDEGTTNITKTLPTTLTYDASSIEFKFALLDFENQEPFSISVFRNNESIASNGGKGVYGKLKFISNNSNKISSVSTGSMHTEDIKSLLSSISQ